MILPFFDAIESTANQRYLNEVYAHPCCRQAWAVTEKVRGQDISFWWQANGEIELKSNGQLLNSLDYSLARIIDQVRAVNKLIRIDRPFADHVVIHGVMCGPTIDNTIYYGERNKFLVVDIVATMGDSYEVLPLYEAMVVTCGINHVPIFKVLGTLQDVVNVDCRFSSRVCRQQLRTEHNFAEGVVIRPYRQDFYLPDRGRVALKKEIDGFDQLLRTIAVQKVRD